MGRSMSYESTGLTELIDRLLDKGLIINADISISVAGTELIGIKLRAALSSFETAAKFGLAFPSGTDLTAPAWKILESGKSICPECRSGLYAKTEKGCLGCGWKYLDYAQSSKKEIDG
ncbi:gas vesicle protein [Candidatus Woesearchaeota archaeon]|nr:gas vesicle protein [Candidatus Woesearchaeota archaeon]